MRVKVYQVVFDRKTKKVIEKRDVTKFFKGCFLSKRNVEYEKQFKQDALNGMHGNVYYEIEGINHLEDYAYVG